MKKEPVINPKKAVLLVIFRFIPVKETYFSSGNSLIY